MEFNCSVCHVACAHASEYNRHLNTAKHKQRANAFANGLSFENVHGCDICGKIYKFSSGLSIHKRTHALQTQTQTQTQPQPHSVQPQDKQFSDLIEVV